MEKIKNITGRSLIGLISICTILIFLNSCEKSTDEPGPNEVFIRGMAFTPSTITVPVNTTITWTNKDTTPHTVSSTTAEPFHSPNMSKNNIFTYKFTTAGNFPYRCSLHPSMTATVNVN